MDELDLWGEFSDRVATIYLPDRRRTMLPTIIGDYLCSLQEHQRRFVLAMDLVVNDTGIIDVRFTNALISVAHNYTYDSPRVFEDNVYNHVAGACGIISDAHPEFRRGVPDVRGPRDVVAYLMLLMNYQCAKNLSAQDKNGIYRATVFQERAKIPASLPEGVYAYLHNWNNYRGEYIHGIRVEHEILELGCYVHITSPIRRLVDLLNMVAFQKNNFLLTMSEGAHAFYDRWTTVERMDAINVDMRAIRRVQNDCDLLKMCATDLSVTEREYTGVVFDRVERSDGLFQYMVYLPDLNLSSRMTHAGMLDNYASGTFKVFVFTEEDNMRRKVRVGMVGDLESGRGW
jgi:exoribonuclease R